MTTLDDTKSVAKKVVSAPLRHEPPVYHPTERDARRDAHIRKLVDDAVGPGARPYYDSVVIVGAGFSASIMAARLARSERFHGKVVLAGPRAEESRRLKDGATLRGHGTDYICYALGVPQYAFVNALYGDIVDGRGVGTGLFSAMTTKSPTGSFEFGRMVPVMGGPAGATRPLFYGIRNSRAQAAIHDLMDRSGVIEVPEVIKTRQKAFALAPGKRPLIVNASHNSGLLRDHGPKVDWATVAVQAPLIVRPSGLRYIDSNAALFAGVRRGKKIDVGLFNPYGDPLSPRSSFYGIIVVEMFPGEDKQQELDTITDELYGIADKLGMDVDDPNETLYSGVIPGSPWKAPPISAGHIGIANDQPPGSVGHLLGRDGFWRLRGRGCRGGRDQGCRSRSCGPARRSQDHARAQGLACPKNQTRAAGRPPLAHRRRARCVLPPYHPRPHNVGERGLNMRGGPPAAQRPNQPCPIAGVLSGGLVMIESEHYRRSVSRSRPPLTRWETQLDFSFRANPTQGGAGRWRVANLLTRMLDR